MKMGRLGTLRAQIDDIATQYALAKRSGTEMDLEPLQSIVSELLEVMKIDTLEKSDMVKGHMMVGSGLWMLGRGVDAFPHLWHVASASAAICEAQDQISAIMMTLPLLKSACKWADIIHIVDQARLLCSGSWIDHSLPFLKGLALNNLSRHKEAAECLEEAIDMNPSFEQAFVEFDHAACSLGDLQRCRNMAQKLVDQGIYWVNCWQRPPHFLSDANMISRPWHDASVFDFTRELESRFLDIKGELDNLLAEGLEWGRVGTSDRGNENSGHDGLLVARGDWREIVLLGDSDTCEHHCRKCPQTVEILRNCQQVSGAAELKLGESLFSMLKPGTHLRPHCGPTNMRLTCHLGIDIPEGCSITCGGDTRTWQEGKCIIFDDSYEHEVVHNGDRPRVVLLVNFWHPALPTERWKDLVDSINASKKKHMVRVGVCHS